MMCHILNPRTGQDLLNNFFTFFWLRVIFLWNLNQTESFEYIQTIRNKGKGFKQPHGPIMAQTDMHNTVTQPGLTHSTEAYGHSARRSPGTRCAVIGGSASGQMWRERGCTSIHGYVATHRTRLWWWKLTHMACRWGGWSTRRRTILWWTLCPSGRRKHRWPPIVGGKVEDGGGLLWGQTR
jgi:hypothetical protein